MSELVQLVSAWENFKEAYPKGDVQEFGQWLTKQKSEARYEENKKFSAKDPAFEHQGEETKLTLQAGYLIGKLYQYLTVYSKPVMKKHGLHSMDDFGYLATVDWYSTIAKTKACAAMLHEVTTGTDIIKRLIRLGFLKELNDKNDGRQKLLQLTAKGKKALAAIQIDFAGLPDVLGDLKKEDRQKLVGWLIDLDVWHDQKLKEYK